MKKTLRFLLLALAALMIVGCTKDASKEEAKAEDKKVEEKQEVKENKEEKKEEKSEAETVEVEDINGKLTVPFKPERVVALDNRTFETLYDWGIKMAALPKDIMSSTSGYLKDDSIPNIGNHKEPNLEIIAAADPQLIIVGQRFGKYTDELKKLCPNAVVMDLNWNVTDKDGKAGENLANGLKTSTLTLGKIFDKNEEAEKLCADFDKAIENAKAAYNKEDKVMAVVVSGGKIGFAAPGSGRVWGPMYQIFGWTPALEIQNASTDHKGDDVSVEAIADSNPDIIMVLDRDAAVQSGKESTPALDVIKGSEALKNVKAVVNDKIIIAPADTYTNESIQTYIKLFNDIAEALK